MLGLFVLIPEDRSASLRVNEPHIVSVPGSLELTRDRFQIRTVRHSFLTQIGCFGLLSHSDQ